MASPTIKLASGKLMPLIGLGTWKAPKDVTKNSVIAAIEAGYRHIDCAHAYQNESAVGEAIKHVIDNGTLKREDLFITSKLWNTYHSKARAPLCIDITLKDLGLDYVDLYLMHWPMGYAETGELFPKNEKEEIQISDVDFVEAWKCMEEMKKQGKCKSIGLSNFNSEQIQRILNEGEIKPEVNQVECHLYLQQKQLHEFCKDKGIVLTAYSPLGSPDRPWAKPDDPKIIDNPVLIELASKYKKTPAQICIRFLTQQDIVTIPKTVTKSRMEENINIFDFKLSNEDLAIIRGLDKHERIIHLTWLTHHKYFPFHIPF